MEALEGCMTSLGLDNSLPEVPAARAEANPLDLCRVHLATILVGILDCDMGHTFKCILWPNDICSGDLAVVLPKLRPGVKASEVAAELMQKVRYVMPLDCGT